MYASKMSFPYSEQVEEDIHEMFLREGDGALVFSKKYSTPPPNVKHRVNGLASFQALSSVQQKVFNPA